MDLNIFLPLRYYVAIGVYGPLSDSVNLFQEVYFHLFSLQYTSK